MRLTRNNVLLTASALVLVAVALCAGVGPGSSANVAVDNCFVSYDMLERPTRWCDGHWTRLGGTVRGRVAGLDTASYRARADGTPSAPESDGNGSLYLVVPEADRNQSAIADLWRAYAVPSSVLVWVRVAIGVLAAAWLVTFIGVLRRRRQGRVSSGTAQHTR